MEKSNREGYYDECFQALQKQIETGDIKSFQKILPAFQKIASKSPDSNVDINHIYNMFLLLQGAVSQNEQAFIKSITEHIPQLKSDHTPSPEELKDFIKLYADIIRNTQNTDDNKELIAGLFNALDPEYQSLTMTNALTDRDYNKAKILLDLSPDTLAIYTEQPMTEALKRQDYETAKNLLDLSPDTLTIYAEKAMTKALKSQDYKTAKELLALSPDTAAQMMIQALESKNHDTAKNILALSPNTLSKAKHSTGKTALMYAVEAGDSQLVDSLLAADKTLNTLPEFGTDYTPLSRAVVSGNLKIVKRLLQDLDNDKTIQAISSNQGFQGKNLIEWATENKHTDIIAYLTAISTILGTQDFTNLSKQEFNKALTDKLIKFLDNQDYDRAKILLDLSPDTLANVKNSTGKTPLMYAAEAGNLDLATLLIQNGADVHATDQTEKTPLMYAAEVGDIELATLLIHNGADVNATDQTGNTPLMYAAAADNIDLATLLLHNGAAVDATDQAGNTPLMISVQADNADMTKTLLNHNADFTIENASGETALDLARSQSQSKLPSTIEMAILKAKTKDWAQTHITPKTILIAAISAISAAALYSQYGPNTMEDEGGHHYS
ncbi:MAG: ankyrin repeat domain-containing protein [Pseudomonadota bacterium]|nr:ankyrin repeat domain-containing protein [Pseudomonadota bacterium]